jgi:hypothetical protein
MSADARPSGPIPGINDVSVIRMSRLALIDPARVETIFGNGATLWLGEPAGEEAGMRTFACDLELRVSPERRSLFRKSALVGLGRPRQIEDGWLVPVEWRAATAAPLFPVFAGTLHVAADRLALEGYYAPPGGTIGHVLDRALLGIAARGTVRWFLANVEEALRAARRPN